MVYADTDFFVALVTDDDGLRRRAMDLLEEHEDELRTTLATFIELFWLCEEYELDRERDHARARTRRGRRCG